MSQWWVLGLAAVLAAVLALWLGTRPRHSSSFYVPSRAAVHGPQAAQVTELRIYPVKSCRGISLRSSGFTVRGLLYDRQWMAVDSKGLFLSQRRYPKMATLVPEIDVKSGVLRLVSDAEPGLKPLELPLVEGKGRGIKVTVWDDTFEAEDCGDEASVWFESAVGVKDARIVRFLDDVCRKVPEKYREADFEQTAFSDGFPYLLASTESLDMLNSWIEKENKTDSLKLPMNRFRPNIVVSGVACGFAEDTWHLIDIGEHRFDVRKPCTRCIIPTTDQFTGKRTGTEPTATLRKYRLVIDKEPKVYFAQNLLWVPKREQPLDPLEVLGELKVGDALTVSRFKKNFQ